MDVPFTCLASRSAAVWRRHRFPPPITIGDLETEILKMRYSFKQLAAQLKVKPEPFYDVFMNYRGKDIREGFVDHLHSCLATKKFSVFKDDCDLLGENIGTGLFKAIDNSKIAIPIISKHYGDSKWCLDELCRIMHNRKQGQAVLPIFYDVDVSDVLNQTGEFGKAFNKLAKHHTPEQVKEWKGALESLAGIGGFLSQQVANGREGQLAKMVVEEVSSVLRPPLIEQIPVIGKKRRKSNCEVFLISSPATAKTFASHLTYDLEREKISVFRDNDQYLIGKDVDREVCNAMDNCKIFIPIISEDFASSRDCLDKLVQMSKCVKKKNEQKILPVFYGMDLSQKVELRNYFWMDMLQHNVPQETRDQWLESIDQVLGIAGHVSENIGNGNGGELVKAVLQTVVKLRRIMTNAKDDRHQYSMQRMISISTVLKSHVLLQYLGRHLAFPEVMIIGIIITFMVFSIGSFGM